MKWIVAIVMLLAACTTTLPETPMTNNTLSATAKATFAGGCFWCMEGIFEAQVGVAKAISGYAGGTTENPTYYDVAGGKTDYREAVQIHYDPNSITYERLVELFYLQIDPTDDGGQFVDRGFQYTTAIWYHDKEQQTVAEQYTTQLNASGTYEKPIVTVIEPFTTFYPAEEEHQDFYKKRSFRYTQYRAGSGRDQFLNQVWGDERES